MANPTKAAPAGASAPEQHTHGPIEAKRIAAELAPHGYQLRLVTDLIEGGQTYLVVRGKEVHCLPTLGDVQCFLVRLECSGQPLHYINGDTSSPAHMALKGGAK